MVYKSAPRLKLASSGTLFPRKVAGNSFCHQVSSLTLCLVALLLFGGSFLLAESLQAPVSNQSGSGQGHGRKPRPRNSDLFSLITHWYIHWPEETFSAIRLWYTSTHWSQINIAPGQ